MSHSSIFQIGIGGNKVAEKYTELYKKYRPDTWDQIVGQDKVINTLRDVPITGKIPTGYMFFGPHGCGKTSTAFVLAKALNCENLQEDGSPCNKCKTCLAIDAGRQPGIRYISMANQGSAEDVRKIVNEATLAQPIKKQVFILDECHRLSPTAFDSLLIPLESETMPALFVFCSTEPDKIPKTILSRVQVRTFNPVDAKTIARNLKHIVDAEHLSVSTEQIVEITKASHGSVRDSISNLENIVAGGVLSGSYSTQVLSMLAGQRYTDLFKLTNVINNDGQSFTEVSQQLYEEFANILVAMGGSKIALSQEAKLFGKQSSVQLILNDLTILGDCITQMSYNTVNNRVLFEIAMTKIITQARKYSASKNKQ